MPPPPTTTAMASNHTSSNGNLKNHNSSNTSLHDDNDDGRTTPRSVPPSRTTRRIIGSASPIHIPRYTDTSNGGNDAHPLRKEGHSLHFKKQGGNGGGGGPKSVFRSSSGSDGPPRRYNDDNTKREEQNQTNGYGEVDESSAHEILLSLSKSYDHGDSDGRRTRSMRNNSIVKIGDGGVRGGVGRDGEKRPESPDEPPRIQHFHKRQSSDNFEVSFVQLESFFIIIFHVVLMMRNSPHLFLFLFEIYSLNRVQSKQHIAM